MKRKIIWGAIVSALVVVVALSVLISLTRSHQSAPINTAPPSLHKQFVNSDEAYKIVGNRLAQEAKKCSRLNISVAEKNKRTDSVAQAGQVEIARLQASHFKEPFDREAFDRDIERRIAAK